MSLPQDTKVPYDETVSAADDSDTADSITDRDQAVEWFDAETSVSADKPRHLVSYLVIPGSMENKMTATATVPAAASVSAGENHAVVLVFVDQSVIVGDDAPSATASAVQVTLERVGSQWLISGFDPK